MRNLTLDDIEDHMKDWLLHNIELKERIEELEKHYLGMGYAFHVEHERPKDAITVSPFEDCQHNVCATVRERLKPDCKRCGDQGEYMVMRPGMFVPCEDCNPVDAQMGLGVMTIASSDGSVL
jgi:hypothetical protein